METDSVEVKEVYEVKQEHVEVVSLAEFKHAFDEVRDASITVNGATSLALTFQDRNAISELQSILEPIFLKYKRPSDRDPKGLFALENVKIVIRGSIKRNDHDKPHHQAVYFISFPSANMTKEFKSLLQEQVNLSIANLGK